MKRMYSRQVFFFFLKYIRHLRKNLHKKGKKLKVPPPTPNGKSLMPLFFLKLVITYIMAGAQWQPIRPWNRRSSVRIPPGF
jgi:hypothetical protein